MIKRGTCKALCVHFCAYYKPGKNEELACRGYHVVERLLRHGRRIELARTRASSDPVEIAPAANKLCSACDFRIDGCDFAVDHTSVPCGGLLLLSQLLAQGIISESDME